MTQVEKIAQEQVENTIHDEADVKPSSDTLFSRQYIANDDHKTELIGSVDNKLKTTAWSKVVSLSNFFAGAFIALLGMNVTYWLIQSQYDISISEIAAIAAVVFGMAWLVSLVIQNNSLILAYRESEITRLRPDTITQAARELSRDVEAMERQIEAYSVDVANAVSLMRKESGSLDGQFRAGAAEIRDVLGQWTNAREDMTSRFHDIKNIIVIAENSIKESIQNLPIETKATSDEIIRNFNSHIDDLIGRMKAELAADEKFAKLANSLKEIEGGVEKLFSSFEIQFIEKIDAIKPSLLETTSKTAQDISEAVSRSNQDVVGHLDRVVVDLKNSNTVFFEKFPPLLSEFKSDTQNIVQQFSESVSESNRTIISTIKDEKTHFEEEYKAAMKSLSDFVKEVSKEIKDTTNLLETDFDSFLGKFNFNFIGKLNFFSELVESKTHHFSDRMLEEIDLLKRNFAELANSFSQIIESSIISFDRRSEYMTVEIENHLSGMISKSLANIATRLDLFEEQVSSRINKMNVAIGGDPNMARRQPVQSRFNNDYLSILEQQMNDINRSLYELKQGSSGLTRK